MLSKPEEERLMANALRRAVLKGQMPIWLK